MDAINVEMHRAGAPIQRRVVILAPGGYVDDLRLDVLGDLTNVLLIQLAPGEARQGGSRGDHQCSGSGDTRARRRLRGGLQLEASFWREVRDQFRGERVRMPLRAAQIFEASVGLVAFCVDRTQANRLPGDRRDAACSQDRDSEI